MDGALLDAVIWQWLSAGIRWLHVIAAIAWIGSSFYFIHLDASLRRRSGLPEGVGGEAWQVHGGGFYRMQKYVVAPADLPDELTWFKWEAYTTWISGFLLLVVVYYAAADLYMVDSRVMTLPTWAAIGLSAGSLLLGVMIYDRLCRSPLGQHDLWLALVGLAFLTLASWVYTELFSGRAAMLHTGALIGTMMVSNVAHVIIPNQRKIVAALLAGQDPDPALGLSGKQRSVHNNYLTLPVIFLMISGHLPLVFESRLAWLIVTFLLIMGAAIRHFYNRRHAGAGNVWWSWVVAAFCLAVIVGLSWPMPAQPSAEAGRTPVDLAVVEEIIVSRCSMCHAAEPVWPGLATAPKGVELDSADAILRHAREIYLQTVLTQAMPPANVTEISEEERRILGLWLRKERATAPADDGSPAS